MPTPFMMIATLAYGILLVGYRVRRSNKKLHVTAMMTGIMIDVILVLILQVQRSAIQTAVGFTLPTLQQFHILFSTLALCLYFPTVYLGLKLLRAPKVNAGTRRLHVRIATSALIFRTLGFLLMFSLLMKEG